MTIWYANVNYDENDVPGYRGIYVNDEADITKVTFASGNFDDDYRSFQEWSQSIEKEHADIQILESSSFATWSTERLT